MHVAQLFYFSKYGIKYIAIKLLSIEKYLGKPSKNFFTFHH